MALLIQRLQAYIWDFHRKNIAPVVKLADLAQLYKAQLE